MTSSIARLALVWAALGVVVGVPLDALHVVTGVLSYRAPASWMPFGLQAWWVLPLYAGAGIALGFGHRFGATPLASRLGPAAPLPASTTAATLLAVGALVVAYGSSGFLQSWLAVASLGYVALFVVAAVRVADAGARRALVLHALGSALVGPAIEALISSTGAFSYAHPDVLGVPLWLPGIYLNAGVASHALDRALLRR